jgi:hypothetical protein
LKQATLCSPVRHARQAQDKRIRTLRCLSCPQAVSTGRARLNRIQARSSTDCSQPRRRNGLINCGLPRKFRVGMSIASCSRAVTYGPQVRACCSRQRGVDPTRRLCRDCGSSRESSCPGRVSDGVGRSNLCPQLCPVVGIAFWVEKRPARTYCPGGPCDVGATGFEPATS